LLKKQFPRLGKLRVHRLRYAKIPLRASNVAFDPDNLNQQLNSVLFESTSLGDAMTKLRIAQQQAEDFVSEIERALRRN